MSTPNFITQKDFPLYVFDDEQFCEYDEDGNFDYFDDISASYFYSDIENILNDFNDTIEFHRIIVKSGYYSGSQLYVETTHDFYDINDIDEEDAEYYFDSTRDEVINRCNDEATSIVNWMRNNAPNMGAEEYLCVGIFSNGEAIYVKAEKDAA